MSPAQSHSIRIFLFSPSTLIHPSFRWAAWPRPLQRSCLIGEAFLTCLTSLLHFSRCTSPFCQSFFFFFFLKPFHSGLSVHPHRLALHRLALPGNERNSEWNAEVGVMSSESLSTLCSSEEFKSLIDGFFVGLTLKELACKLTWDKLYRFYQLDSKALPWF